MKDIKRGYLPIRGKNGSMTVEAAIVLPIFISVVISIAFFIKIVYVHQLVQHSITETAEEMAAYAYIYHVSGLQETHDTARDGIKSRAQLFKDHITTVLDSYDSLKGMPEEASDKIEEGKLEETGELVANAVQNFKNITDAAGEAAQNPLEELKSAAAMIMGGAFDDINNELFIPLVGFYMKKHLVAEGQKDPDARLRGLNVVNGLKGLDFGESSFFEDENNDIYIVVKYRLSIPVPFKVLPNILMVQSAVSKAWLGGDEVPVKAGGEEVDVWSLGNFQRGSAIRERFGANLPGTFPVISIFDPRTGKAVMIKSMDLTAKSYQTGDGVKKQLLEYISTLEGYAGQEEPWGKTGIVIKGDEIKEKVLLLVIPENKVGQDIEKAIDECIANAAQKGISLKVQRYGVKKTAQEDDASDGSAAGGE